MLALFVALILAGAAAAQPSVPARGWDTYRVMMWSTGNAYDRNQWVQRLRELGFDAEQCTGCGTGPYLANDFGFYLENLVPELGFLNNRNSIYQNDWNNYTKTREKQYLVRKPSFSDPAFWDAAAVRLRSLVWPYVGQKPLLYQLRDELSIGSYASPMDYDFDPKALGEFRDWLRNTYGSLEALNAGWETSFASWDDVQPMTTYEVKDRERPALAAGNLENYAPWADHRDFMDRSFARALDRLRGYIREFDTATPVGIEGTQMPSAWGGYDLWRLSQAIDWVEPYDICGSREVWRSFMPQGSTIVSTVFGSDFPHIRQRLWWLLLSGDRGALVWDDEASRSIVKEQDGMAVTDRGRGLAGIFAELKQAAPQIFRLKREDDRIAIHYSQASLRAHWMFDSREDKDTWPRRFSSYEATWSRIARVRDSFMRVVNDLGFQFNFVSYEQLENGELTNGGYRVLLLPQSVAMSAQECRRVEEFVRAGGTVIADNMIATMDEHCRRLPKGQLDELFGIRRSGVGWRAKPAAGKAGDLDVFEPDVETAGGAASLLSDTKAPAVIVNQAGDGRAIYLNLDMHTYGKLRLDPPGGQAYRDLFRQLLADRGLTPALTVVNAEDRTPVPCVRVWRYTADDGQWFAVMRNPEFGTSSLKAAGYPDNAAIEVPVRVRMAGAGGRFIEAMLDPWSPVVFKADSMQEEPAAALRRRR